MSPDVLEPMCIAPAYVDGLAAVCIDQAGVAHVNLYADQLQVDGLMARILIARLTMPREAMREIADRMLTETMVASHHRGRAAEERRRRMD